MLMVVLLYVLAGAPLTGTADVSSVVVSSMKELSTLAAPRSGVVIILDCASIPMRTLTHYTLYPASLYY